MTERGHERDRRLYIDRTGARFVHVSLLPPISFSSHARFTSHMADASLGGPPFAALRARSERGRIRRPFFRMALLTLPRAQRARPKILVAGAASRVLAFTASGATSLPGVQLE